MHDPTETELLELEPDTEEIAPGLFTKTDRQHRRLQRADDADRERTSPSTVTRGGDAEERAAQFLVDKGLAIVETNYRCRVGEIDIVARDGTTLVFVEVRSRYSRRYGSGVEMVTLAKQRQVSRVAAAYLALKRPRERRYRFDVVALTGREVVHIADAWRL